MLYIPHIYYSLDLQPDPHQLEKEAMREFEKRKQQEFFKRKNMEEELKNQAEELHDQHRKEEMDLIQPWGIILIGYYLDRFIGGRWR